MDIAAPGKIEQAIQTTLPLKIVIVGHVDHGKSTLVGRLFHDTGTLPEGRVEAVRAMCEKRGMPFEWAFLLDALQAERDQGITIDISQIFFRTALRNYVLIDAPGHREFVKNMITGAAQAEAAVLVIDAREGMQEQTRRHAYLLHLLGIHQIVVAINKMDMAEYSESRFQQLVTDVRDYFADLGLDLRHTIMIPLVARDGDNIVAASNHMRWYAGPTLAEALDQLQPPVTSQDLPLRFPVQDIYKFDERRIIAGRIESGYLRKGDTLLFSPSNKQARIASIEEWNARQPVMAVRAGKSIGVTLDEPIFVERGEIASLESRPPMLTNVFRGRIFWLGRRPLAPGDRYKMKLCTGEHLVEVEKIEKVIDVNDLGISEPDHVDRNAIAEVVLRSRRTLALDPFDHNMFTGRFVLVEDYDIVGGGLISMDGYADQRQQQRQIHQHFPRRAPGADRRALEGERPSGRHSMDDRPVRRRQVDSGVFARAAPFPKGLSRLRARRRQRAPRALLRPRLLAAGPGREHPARRAGRRVVRQCRLSGADRVHLPVPGRPRSGAGDRAGYLPRDLHRRRPEDLRNA